MGFHIYIKSYLLKIEQWQHYSCIYTTVQKFGIKKIRKKTLMLIKAAFIWSQIQIIAI